MKNIKHILWAFVAVVVLHSCAPADGNHPGSEYMPDMGHSIAQEANVFTDYYYNTWDSASVVKLKELPIAGLPAKGAVPRGYAGTYLAANQEGGASADAVMAYMNGKDQIQGIAVPVNGSVPYYYEDTEPERERAIAEIIDNPFPITAEGLAKGEDLYNKFCGICHGEKGDGVGYLVSDENPNAVYPAAPANFLLDQFLEASNGRYYHAIMYGKNVMGGYADKISYEERWQVIHWIRALQAKEKKLEYNAETNTLNPEFGMPASQAPSLAQKMTDEAEMPAEAGDHSESDHSEEGDHGDDHSHGDGGHGKK
ncbi:c-type cytochrome [Phaeodactylibacter sp.]|uniref:c-type cytochrome n=1 Tax=Phaeodactylibacter sp. TaxID=1940289 RepID=UPI0025D8B96F|nr:c-type cytochrome [Phaeodactylibacter sp.]MCI4647301.1 c-type cytochrome [Phaeodactylibacter sp.]MCI5091117.1 c-type cytochrome [Phaeodactylibacter sp.]